MTIGDLLKNKDYDYISYRIKFIGPDKKEYNEFCGCFKSKKGKIISLDGDTYAEDEEVLEYEEWENLEKGIKNGLTIVVEG